MIAAGLAFIERFSWVVYVFGGLLIVTAIRMLRAGDEKVEPERNPLVRLVRRVYPIVGYREHHFLVQENGRRAVTTLLLALVMVESTDLLFAVDSIPAVFAVTRDPFVVFTSNVFAILGLRSLYFALAAVLERFHYLKFSLVFILAFVGAKMILTHHYPIPAWVSLIVIVTALLVGVLASLMSSKRELSPASGRATSTAGD
jgi:tellurite resistance protein TerC